MDNQNENLKDILGFDPNDAQESSRTSEQNLTPLKKASLASGLSTDQLKEEFMDPLVIGDYKDPDNLFTFFRYTEETVVRRYYRWDKEGLLKPFSSAIETHIATDNDAPVKIETKLFGEREEVTKIHWTRKGEVHVHRFITNDRNSNNNSRSVNMDYNVNGDLIQIDMQIPGDPFPNKMVYDDKEGRYKLIAARHLHLVGSTKMDWETSEDGKKQNFTFSKGEEVTDMMSFPTSLGMSTEDLMHEVYPDELLQNPTNPDPSLDENAKLDPFFRIGATWEVLGRTRNRPDVSDVDSNSETE